MAALQKQKGGGCTNLLLGQVIREVSNHDLGLGRDTVGRGAALPTLPGTSLGFAGLALLLASGLVGDVLQSLGLSNGGLLSGSGALLLLLILVTLSVACSRFEKYNNSEKLTPESRPPRARPPRPRPARPRPRVE